METCRAPGLRKEFSIVPIPPSFGFYSILTNPVRGYEYCTKLLVQCGIAFVQLRMKDAPRKDVLEIARMMRAITRGTETRLIINDDPQIARESGADGVHLGQDDIPFGEARKIVGENAIIGLSTHSLQQMRDACALRPAYVGVGPVFATPTKKNPDPVIGLDGMRQMIAQATVPAVAIGGITLENLAAVLQAGAINFCMVREVAQSQDPEKVLKEVVKRLAAISAA